MGYERLRADYDAAFDGLREEVCRLRSTTQQLSPNRTAGDVAEDRLDRAQTVYRECRDRLASFLTSCQPVGRPAGVMSAGTDREATGSDQGAFGHSREVQLLAYRLWEEAGRPMGDPDKHWYRAEELLGSSQ